MVIEIHTLGTLFEATPEMLKNKQFNNLWFDESYMQKLQHKPLL